MLLLGTPDDAIISTADLTRTGRTHGVQPRWFSGLGHDLMLETDRRPLDETLSWLDELDSPTGHTPKESS